MRRQGREPAPLQDDDILTAMDIAEIHEQAQSYRGMRVDRPVTLALSRYEMVCSRSEYVAMAETLKRLMAERDELRRKLRDQFRAAFALLRECLGSDLGRGGGLVEIIDGIESLRQERDELRAELALRKLMPPKVQNMARAKIQALTAVLDQISCLPCRLVILDAITNAQDSVGVPECGPRVSTRTRRATKP